MTGLEPVLKAAKKLVTPSADEEKRITGLAEFLLARTREAAGKHQEVRGVVMGGSFAKGTWLPTNVDIDVFVLIDPATPEKDFERIGLTVGTKAAKGFPRGKKYAQHPYVEATVRGIKVNVTLVFSPLQGLAAAKCGASFVSPFVGRLDDIGEDGFGMVKQLVTILHNYAYPTQVLVASVRSPAHLLRAAEVGSDVATVPFAVMKQMLHHSLTDAGLARFLADWHATRQKI